MKPWLYRSSAILLSGSLLIPVPASHANTIQASQSVSSQGSPVALAAAKDVKLSKDAALAIAKRMVPGNDMELKSVSFRSADTWRSFPEWSFSWEKKVPDKNEVQVYFSVSVHANSGELTSYSHHDQNSNKLPYANRVSYEDARKAAEQFLKSNNPGKAAKTTPDMYTTPPKTPLHADSIYTFRFSRVEDGIRFPDNNVEISVNGAGKIINYSLMWNEEIKFDRPSKTISAEDAKEIMREKTPPSLSYLIPWDAQGDQRNKPVLAYTNPFSMVIDAKSGDVLDGLLAPIDGVNEPIPVSSKRLPARHTGKNLTQEEAVKIASQLFPLAGFELRSAQYSESDYRGNRPVWDLSYEKKDSDDYDYAHLSIDASTGDIYNFSKKQIKPLEKDTASSKRTAAEYREKAMETIRKWSPTLAHELYWNEHSETKAKLGSTEEYSVTFQRYVNGVKAATGSSAVSFDPATGEILYYNADIGKETYPAQIPDHLSAEEAADAWWKEAEIEPVFMLEQLTAEDQKKIRQQPAFIPSRSAKLVYRANSTVFDEPYFLDAVSGEWRSQSSGKPVVLHRIDPVDLDGHPAAKELLLMYEYDALSLEDGKLLPDKTITRGEMIEMLMISINRGRYFPIYSSEREASFSDVSKQSRYFSAVENAVDSGLLDKQSSKLNPDEAITREELADMIVRALGYKNLAQYSNMFQSDLTDIANSPKRGSIIIATTLGIVPTDKQTFRPQATVSRADAAITFSRFLEKRSEQDTQPSVPR